MDATSQAENAPDRPDAGLAHQTFELPDGRILHTGECVHGYPGKRVLLRGRIDDSDVIAKFYLRGLRGWHEWRRGSRGAHALITAGLPAPGIHYSGFLPAAGAWLLLLDFIDQDKVDWPPVAAPNHHWHELTIRTLAAHHRAGIVQNDLNWTNFRPHNGVLYTLDSDRIRSRSAPARDHDALWNLIRLYAYKCDFSDPDIRVGYRMYCSARNWPLDAANQQAFVDHALEWRRKIASGVAKRSLRGWKYYKHRKTAGWNCIVDSRRIDSKQLPHLIEIQQETVSNQVILHVDGTTLRGHGAIGRHWPCTPAPAERLWMLAVMLRRLRITTELPAIMLTRRTASTCSEGWVYTLAQRTQPLEQYANDADRREAIIRRIGMLLTSLHHAGLQHPGPELESFGATANGTILLRDWPRIRATPAFTDEQENVRNALTHELAQAFQLPEEHVRALIDNPFIP